MPKGIYQHKKRLEHNESLYQRLFRRNKYKKAGCDYQVFLKLIGQDCHYCGAAPKLVNPIMSEYKQYTNSNNCTYEYWLTCWIPANGIDKKNPCDNYRDEDNLVACCRTCNFLKGTLSYNEFLQQCDKVVAYRAKCAPNTSALTSHAVVLKLISEPRRLVP